LPWRPAHCPRCGEVNGLIVEAIPIELAEYACPTCSNDDLRFSVLRVELLVDGSYGFVVAAECPGCQHRSRLRRALGALRGITKISVGPAGIEMAWPDIFVIGTPKGGTTALHASDGSRW